MMYSYVSREVTNPPVFRKVEGCLTSGAVWQTLWSELNAEKLSVTRRSEVRGHVALYISRDERLLSSEVLERVCVPNSPHGEHTHVFICVPSRNDHNCKALTSISLILNSSKTKQASYGRLNHTPRLTFLTVFFFSISRTFCLQCITLYHYACTRVKRVKS
ncbi:unnamed protein product [Macrosiphum euphorbiae]|uniref:Uncharacterized protein n=1 Tax=Macrosiphum euphorbiae TaxID=13131 RepID=A0AAV0XI71_9HEMI|nr:unnamed protein product [Macrosiphum euphorbiae]